MAIEEVLDGKRYKRRYRNHDLYMSLVEKAGALHAVQVSVSDKNINKDAHTLANVEFSTRDASLIVRAYGVDMAVRELENCALGSATLPAIIAGVIKEHCGV